MKQMPLRPEQTARGRIIDHILAVLILISIDSSLHAQSLVPELVFMNPQLKSGAGCSSAGNDGAVYIFSNVAQGIDALVTVQGRSSPLVTLTTPDLAGPEQDNVNGTGYDNAWQPRVCYANGNAPANNAWWMEFKVSFVKHDSASQSVSVNQFFVSGLDIDGDGQSLHEFQTFYNMQYFTLEENTAMTSGSYTGCLSDPRLDGKRFDGSTKNYPGITTSASDVMVSNFYSNTNSLIVRVGAVTGTIGSSASNRMYSLWFKSMTFDLPVSTPLPLTLVAFNAQLSNNKDVNLSWTTTMEQNTSHFTLQRSLDGNEFDDDAMIFTDGNSDIRKDYHYTDHLTQTSVPLVYYRLKLVNLDSRFEYSDVVVVKVQQNESAQLIIYPNPATTELRITIPASWQSKTIAYSLYNSSGKLMKQQVSGNAGQTQTLHVEELPAGLYIIQTANGKQTATQKFIKTNS